MAGNDGLQCSPFLDFDLSAEDGGFTVQPCAMFNEARLGSEYVPLISFVGVTNSGKSRLLSQLLDLKVFKGTGRREVLPAVHEQPTSEIPCTRSVDLYSSSAFTERQAKSDFDVCTFRSIVLIDTPGTHAAGPPPYRMEALHRAIERDLSPDSVRFNRNASRMHDLIEKVMPAILYGVSDIIVVVTKRQFRDSSLYEEINELVRCWKSTAWKPVLVVVRNMCDRKHIRSVAQSTEELLVTAQMYEQQVRNLLSKLVATDNFASFTDYSTVSLLDTFFTKVLACEVAGQPNCGLYERLPETHTGSFFDAIQAALQVVPLNKVRRFIDAQGHLQIIIDVCKNARLSALETGSLSNTDIVAKICSTVAYYRKAAEEGDLHAMYSLALCFSSGEGVPKDGVQAVNWFRKAADNGSTDAMHDLGLAYEYGDGIEKNMIEAVRFYTLAARKGCIKSQQRLQRKDLSKIAASLESGADLKSVDTIGLLRLSKPQIGVVHTFDIVFVHGLHSGNRSAWINESGILWPQDWLSLDLPNAAIYTYGYENGAVVWGAREPGALSLSEQADQFRLSLRRDGIGLRRPLVFVGHSMGGLVIKQALVNAQGAASSRLSPDDIAKQLVEHTAGVVFFSTPHRGAVPATWLSFLKSITGITVSVEALGALQHSLLDLNKQFVQVNIPSYSLGERRKYIFYTLTAPVLGIKKHLELMIVEEWSSDIGGGDPHPCDGYPKDHVSICKPRNPEENVYQEPLHRIKGFLAKWSKGNTEQ